MVMAAIALVDVDGTGRHAGLSFEIGDHRTKRVAVEGVTVQGLGVQHELTASWCGNRRHDRDLAAELVGCSRLALANALDLGSMQRIDLRPALAMLLVAHLDGEIA